MLRTEYVDGVVIVQLPDGISHTNRRAFEKDMESIMDENSEILFDMTQVTRLDSVGLGAILGCLKHQRASGGDLKLFGTSRQIRTLLELVRMHHVLDIFNTRREALESYYIGHSMEGMGAILQHDHGSGCSRVW